MIEFARMRDRPAAAWRLHVRLPQGLDDRWPPRRCGGSVLLPPLPPFFKDSSWSYLLKLGFLVSSTFRDLVLRLPTQTFCASIPTLCGSVQTHVMTHMLAQTVRVTLPHPPPLLCRCPPLDHLPQSRTHPPLKVASVCCNSTNTGFPIHFFPLKSHAKPVE